MQKYLTLFFGLIAAVALLGLSAGQSQAYSSYGSDCSQPGCHATGGSTNNPPTANAGPDQTVDEGQSVALSGSGSSDPDGDSLTYSWTQTGGDAVALSNDSSASPRFTAPAVGSGSVTLTFELTVTDPSGESDTDSCIVNVSWVNEAPTANAGLDQSVQAGDTVALSGQNSTDPDDGVASYSWTQVSGTSVELDAAGAAETGFIAPTPAGETETLVFELTVTDAAGLSDTDSVSVTVSAAPSANQTPTADAGSDQTVDGGEQVALNGSNSTDSDGVIQSWAWTQTEGAPVTLSDPAAPEPTFTAPEAAETAQTLTFSLTVTDDAGQSATDSCVVTVAAIDAPQPNQPPVADAGPDQSAAPAENVVLDGSASYDSDDGVATWKWLQTGGPQVVLTDPDSDLAGFAAPEVESATSLTFELTVTDLSGESATDVCVVNIIPVAEQGQAPVADAGADVQASTGDIVTLDASASFDPDGGALSLSWKQLDGKPVTLSSPNEAAPSFTMPRLRGRSTLVFEVTVTDEDGMQATDQVRVEGVRSGKGGRGEHGDRGNRGDRHDRDHRHDRDDD